LSGANTYSGVTSVTAGILNLKNSAALGATSAGTTVTSGAVLQIDGSGLTIAEPVTSLSGSGISNGGAILNLANNNTWSGAITQGAASRINSDAGTLTISGAVGGAYLLSVGGAGNTTISSIIGAGPIALALTKDGSGTLTLSGANAYSGITALSTGTLNINNASAIGTGTFTIAAGTTINNTSGGAITLSTNNIQQWNGDFTFTGTQSLNMGNGAVTLGTTIPRIVTVSANIFTAGGTIAQPARSLTKAGAGTLSFGTNTVNVLDLVISAGTLTSTTGNLDIESDFTNNATFTHNSGTVSFTGTTTAAQIISGTATVTNFNNLTINTAGSISLNQDASTTTAGILNLTDGIVTPSSGSLFTVKNTSLTAITNASVNCYFNGPIARAMVTVASPNSYLWPTGKSTGTSPGYFAFELVGPTVAASTTISAEYFSDAPPSPASGGAPISGLYPKYWETLTLSGSISGSPVVRLNQTTAYNGDEKIGQSSTANGVYNYRAGTIAGLTLTSNNTVTTVSGSVGYFSIGHDGHFSGTVTVGPGAAYPSFTNDDGLFEAMNVAGVGGNVTALVIGNITNESGDNALNNFTEFPNTSSMVSGTYNWTLTITPSDGTPRTVSGNYTGTSASNAGLFRFDDADRVTIDGNNPSTGTGTLLTFKNTNTSQNAFNSTFNFNLVLNVFSKNKSY
jgi:autotransporter-associated beta strand protein